MRCSSSCLNGHLKSTALVNDGEVLWSSFEIPYYTLRYPQSSFFFSSWVPLRVLDILDLGTMTPKAFSSQGDAIHSKQQKEDQTLDFSS